ncbi:hypothetical protein Hdeb2414_s0002g00064181 [Helianthus debilis subsp. tardiflorus]
MFVSSCRKHSDQLACLSLHVESILISWICSCRPEGRTGPFCACLCCTFPADEDEFGCLYLSFAGAFCGGDFF